jgi:PAS domain S-box-containing protein
MTGADDANRRPRRGAPKSAARSSAEAEPIFESEAGSGGAATAGSDLHRLLVDSVRDYAIFALDPAGHIISWNPGAERIKGYTASEIIGQHFSKFYPAHDIAAGKPAWELEVAIREGKFEEEGWRLRKDGTRFWANVVITPLRDEMGTLLGFAKVTRDLTERRLAEETLRASEERFQLLVQSVRDYGIFMLDPKGYIASWNQGAFHIKGYTAQEAIGRHFSMFYPADDVAAGKPAWELEVAIKEGKFEEEGWRVRKDGSLFWANVVITALWSKNGTLAGFAKVTRDLTERRAAQVKAVEDARRIAVAEVANKAKSEFLAAMSHELRTPLNAIGGYAELLELGIGGPITSQQREYLHRIRGSEQHLLGIVTDLLNYSRIEAGQVTYSIAPVRARDVLASVIPLVEPQAAAKGLTLSEGRCDDDIVASADKTKVEQILLNLLSNAVKYTDEGGLISVDCAVVENEIRISVRDTGAGIPADKQLSIFEPFVQLGRNLTSPHEGTGLGLAISRDLARAMGGEVAVESVVNEGSTFTLTLPREGARSRESSAPN